ncbi:MAG: hypothetical protein ACE5D8_10430 [Fidelibacterota bacterium]
MKAFHLIIMIIIQFMVNNQAANSQTLYNGIGHIPVAYQERWNQAGLLTDFSNLQPRLVINFNCLPGANDDAKIDTALSQARNHIPTGGLAIIYFPAGAYFLHNTIQLTENDRNIIFQGAGSDKTTLNFAASLYISPCFSLTGGAGVWSDLNQNFNKGDSIIHAPSGGLSDIDIGEWLHFIKYQFDYNPPSGSTFEKEIVGQITRLEAKGVSNDWGEIKDVANMDYIDSTNPEYSLKVRKITPVQNIGIENLKIQRLQITGGTESVYNIQFTRSVNCWVRGVESYKASRSHIGINSSAHIEISGCYIHEAFGYGSGGWGYGVSLSTGTTNCLIENNAFRKLRHAMVAGSGANCNVWTFNCSRDQYSTFAGFPYDDRDLDLHARYPFGNLFEYNIIEQIESGDKHGDNGPYNTAYSGANLPANPVKAAGQSG